MAPPSGAWGWHELERRWAERLVAHARVGRGDLVLDVGAGRGVLTEILIASGAHVIAIEAHPERARILRLRFGDAAVVVQADAADLRLPRRPYAVVANPPFSVTTALLRRLLQPGSRLTSATLVLQDQAARHWADPRLATRHSWGRDFAVSLGGAIPRSAFRPRPKVDARMVTIERRRRNGARTPRQ